MINGRSLYVTLASVCHSILIVSKIKIRLCADAHTILIKTEPLSHPLMMACEQDLIVPYCADRY